MIRRIVSGGQTGADRAALDVAIELGIETGGWVPRGRRAEDGRVPERYVGLRETDSDAYDVRTERNVLDSNATLVVCLGEPSGGTALTVALARRHERPLLVLDLDGDDPGEPAQKLRNWLDAVAPEILNVAGPRASKDPGIAAATATLLRGVLRARGSAV